MKIIQLVFSLTLGGAERLVVNLCNEQSKNHDVLLITILNETASSTFYKPQLNKNVRYNNLGCKSGLSALGVFKLMTTFRKEKPNVIHCHLNTLLYCFVPSLYMKSKFVHTLHSIANKSVGFKRQKFINKWFYKSKRIIPIAISKECAASFTAFYNLKEIQIINNGVPNALKTENYNEVKNELKHYTEINDKLKFIHVSRFGAVKNQNVLVKVFNELISDGAPIALLIVGQGFEDLEKEYHKQQGIRFLGARQNPTDFIMQSDCLVLTSLWEGMPMCALEALSCGIPIVSTPAGGMIDVINNNSNGLLSDNFDYISIQTVLLKMIKKLTSDGFNKSEILDMYNKHFSITTCCNNYALIYTTF